jgi:hypothetical protein
MPALPLYSAGARYERKALRAYLKRRSRTTTTMEVLDVLRWVVARQARYEKKRGGL